MITEGLTDPGVVDRIDVSSGDPAPSDYLPWDEEPLAVSEFSSGWIALTDRDVFVYRNERDPALVHAFRANVTGVVVRRAGGRSVLGYAPGMVLYAFAALATGVLLLSISPERLITVPDAPGVGGVETILGTLGLASNLLGSVLVFSGFLAGLIGVVAVGYWLFSRRVSVVVERGEAEPIECPAERHAGNRVLRDLEEALSEE